MLSIKNVSLSVFISIILVTIALSYAIAQEPNTRSLYEQQRNKLNQNTVTIMGSQAKTSYTTFAQDMQNVLDDLQGNTLRVLPILGRGGGQNLVDTLFLQGIDMGIVERDVIDNYKKKDPALYGDVERRLHYILKLANSEMHFFARHEIKKLEDLRGKKMSFYKPGSSSEQAIKTILGACEIEVEGVYADTQLGTEMLRKGELFALGRISGAPHGALIDLTSEDGHFLPLDEENLPPSCFDKLMTMYLPAFLKHDHYPNVIAEDKTIPTVANATLLITYNFDRKTERYRSVEKFVNKLFDNIDKFRDGPRHPKWKEVNVAAEVPGWTRLKAAQDWIDQNKNVAETSPAEPPLEELKTAFERYLEENLTASASQSLTPKQKQALLENFAEWWRKNNGNKKQE